MVVLVLDLLMEYVINAKMDIFNQVINALSKNKEINDVMCRIGKISVLIANQVIME